MKHWLTCLFLLTAALPAQAAPLTQISEGRIVLPAPAATPVFAYELQYAADRPWPGDKAVADDLRARAFPEAISIVAIDAGLRTVRATTTAWGRSALDSVSARITRLSPPAPEPSCSNVFAVLKPDPDDAIIARAGAVCPFAANVDPERHLIVEGLDRRGQRLFAALSDDPRWGIAEAAEPDGSLRLLARGRDSKKAVYVSFRAAVDSRLVKLRVWELDDRAKARRLGDIAWTGIDAR